MLKLEMLPAGCGDCLLLDYPLEGQSRRILIDGGTPGSYPALRARLLREQRRHFDVIVVTHVDVDHIGGVLALLQDRELGVTYDDLWFNGFAHLKSFQEDSLGKAGGAPATVGQEPTDRLGPAQGEALAVLARAGRWNEGFGRKAIVVPDSGDLPRVELPGGVVVTVLSPTPSTLRKMELVWEKELRLIEKELAVRAVPGSDASDRLGGLNVKALAVEPEQRDDAPANGSSIALLVEQGPHSLLLAADAWPHVLATSLQRLLRERKVPQLTVGAVKLPHHGSKRNVTREWLDLVDCRNFLVSTDGSRFGHPDPQAIARIVTTKQKQGIQLHFNAASKSALCWRSDSLQLQYGYRTVYPVSEGAGLEIVLG
jgi:beta-lactamase superfamily II metal-dependent hydrolase